MVYDETDVSRRLLDLQAAHGPNAWPLEITVNVGLSHSWFVGGTAYRALRRIDAHAGFRLWHRALEWLASYHGDQKISEIQYWGHGSPGRVWMDGEYMGADVLDDVYTDLMFKIKARLAPNALIWFRTCATFGADPGRVFARHWADRLGCRIAGHTHNIGVWHSGLHTLAPNQAIQWPRGEGVAEGTPETPKRMLGSGLWKTRTISCLRSTIPSEW